MLAHLIRRFPDLPKHTFPKQEGGLGGARSYPAGSTLLMHAADNLGALEILLAHGADPNVKDAEGRNAIDYIGGGSWDHAKRAAKRLRAAGAELSPWTKISFGEVAEIEQAIRSGRLPVNQAIKKYGDSPHLPLQIACLSHRPDAVAILLKNGAEPFLDGKTDRGANLAAWVGSGFVDRQCLAVLLNGLEPKQMERLRAWRSDEGGTALHHLAEVGNVAAIRLLLKAGIDKAVKNKVGKTAADLACNDVVRRELR